MSRSIFILVTLLGAAGAVAAGVPAFNDALPPSSGVAATAVDAAGNTYLTGAINSTGLPIAAGAAQPAFGGGVCSAVPIIGPPVSFPCNDAFVIKLNSAGSVVWATYLGGDGDDLGRSIAVDGSGNVYVAGTTQASGATNNFPTTAGTPSPTLAKPGSDAFVAKLSADGTRLLYSTFLPGMGWSVQAPMAIDPSGNAYVAGTVNPALAPITATAGAFQMAASTTKLTGAVAKLSADGSALEYATYLGGSGSANDSIAEEPQAIAVDSSGDAYVTGFTASADFPVTPEAFQTKLPGKFESGFVAKLNGSGTGLIFSTYLGGTDSEQGTAIGVDSLGRAYVLGTTTSKDFPVSANAFGASPTPPPWAVQNMPGQFLASLSADGSSLVYATYLAGIAGLAVDAAGDAYLAGFTQLGFPVSSAAYQRCFGGGTSDGLLAEFAPDGTLTAATYQGGSGADSVGSVAIAPGGMVSIAGNENGQGFVASLNIVNQSAVAICMTPMLENAASYQEGAIAPGELVTLRGGGFGPDTGVAATPDANGIWPTELAGVKVLFDGTRAPILYAQSQQINVQAPYELSGRTTTQVQVQYNSASTNTASISVTPTAPAIFYDDYPASLQGAILNQDSTLNSPGNPAHPGEVISIYGTGAGVMGPAGVTGGSWPLDQLSMIAPRVVVLIDFQNADVLYSGSAPTLSSGLFQINARIPSGLSTYSYFMEVQIGGGVGGIPPITTNVAVANP